MRAVHHTFAPHDLVGGDLAVDFVNTVTARDTTPSDWVDDYNALLRWAALTSAFAKKDLVKLGVLAAEEPGQAAAALRRARVLREALCDVFYALIDGRSPSADALSMLDEARVASVKAAKLVHAAGRLAPHWGVGRSAFDLVAHVVTARALSLLEAPQLGRLRLCDGHDCGWVFIDTSKNGKRRWCDMATCGNTAKARRYAERQAE
jgi:predicted RNA-binding Zn ribbon-like protein